MADAIEAKCDILIDLSKKNNVKNYPVEQLFQKEAYEQAKKFFEETKRWFDDLDENNKKSISTCRNHSTILISGHRGSGKTVFLINLDTIHNNSEIHKSFEFLDPIDPTLLNGTKDIESSTLYTLKFRIQSLQFYPCVFCCELPVHRCLP